MKYTTAQLSELTGVSHERIRWFIHRNMLTVRKPCDARGGRNLFDDNDLQLLLVLDQLSRCGLEQRYAKSLAAKGKIKVGRLTITLD